MGNNDSKHHQFNKAYFDLLDYGYCKVWKRKNDSIETVEQYNLVIESEERLKSFQTAWLLRTNHCYFVNIHYFYSNQTNNFCKQVANVSLFTERIPYRLSEFSNVKYQEIYSILKICIEGFSILQNNYGLFLIKSTMIGFTEKFQTKIWLHTDFSQSEPQNPNCKNLQDMFFSLISAVQNACENQYYNYPRFSEFIEQTNYVYFSRDFNWLLNGLRIYTQKMSMKPSLSLSNLKNYRKKPERWQIYKINRIYPRLIQFQNQKEAQILSNICKNSLSQIFFKQKSSTQLESQQKYLRTTQYISDQNVSNVRVLSESITMIDTQMPNNKHINQFNFRTNPQKITIKSRFFNTNSKDYLNYQKDVIKSRNSSAKNSVNNSRQTVTLTKKNYLYSTHLKMSSAESTNDNLGQTSREKKDNKTFNIKKYENIDYFDVNTSEIVENLKNKQKSMKQRSVLQQLSSIGDLQQQAISQSIFQRLKF